MLTRRNISIVFNCLKIRLGQLSPIVKDRRPAGAEPDVAQPLGESLDHLEAEADAVLAFIFVLRRTFFILPDDGSGGNRTDIKNVIDLIFTFIT